MGDFEKKYNSAEIYNNSKASKLENLFTNNNLGDKLALIISSTNISIPIKISKISDFNFDEICKPCIGIKQTWVI